MNKIVFIVVLFLTSTVYAQTSTKTFQLSWTDNSTNEEGFYIYRDGVKVGQVAKDIVTYSESVTGNWGQQFSYQVSAFNHVNVDGTGALQESAKSNTAVATIPVPTQPAPNAPSNLLTPIVTSSVIELRWQDNASNETSQEIHVAQSRPERNWTVPVPADVTNHRLTRLRRRTDYNLKVRAVGDGGVSAYSESVNVTTKR